MWCTCALHVAHTCATCARMRTCGIFLMAQDQMSGSGVVTERIWVLGTRFWRGLEAVWDASWYYFSRMGSPVKSDFPALELIFSSPGPRRLGLLAGSRPARLLAGSASRLAASWLARPAGPSRLLADSASRLARPAGSPPGWLSRLRRFWEQHRWGASATRKSRRVRKVAKYSCGQESFWECEKKRMCEKVVKQRR